MKTTTLMAILLAATGAFAAPAARADKLPFPGAKTLSAKLNEAFVIKKREFDDPSFNFVVAVPPEWGRVMAPFDLAKLPTAPQTLALYRSTAMPAAEIEIQVFPLGREVAAVEWLEQVVRSLGAKTLQLTTHKAPDPVPDALVERVMDGQRYIFRMAAYKNGDRVYLLSGRTTEAGYVANAEAFGAAIVAFDLTKPQAKKYAEPLRDIAVAQPFPATVRMLAAWQGDLETIYPALTTGQFEWKVGKEVMGAMAVKLYPASDEAPTAFDDVFQADLKALGVTVGAPTADTALAAAGDRLGGLLRVYPGTRAGRDVEARLYVLKYAAGWAVLTLLSPGEKANYDALVLNRRAFAVTALELQPGAAN